MATGTEERERHLSAVDGGDADTPDDEATVEPGTSIEDMAAARDEAVDQGEDPDAEEPEPTPPMKIPIPGTIQSISGSFGGRKPDSAEIRLLGGKLPIDGSFNKGETITLLVTAKVTGVLGQDTTDVWGTEESTVRRHMARMIGVQRIVSSEGGGFELADGQLEMPSRP